MEDQIGQTFWRETNSKFHWNLRD